MGRYVLFGELASGGMATVHFGRLAGPVGFSRTVAIKCLHPQFAKDPEFVAMFLDEARLCGRIRHPNVVPTIDVVALPDEIFIVMEYVPGEALSKLLKGASQNGIRMPPQIAATILSSVLHGLHAAHIAKDEHGRELGIVHRDVSPQNILVGLDGVARVLDFGVAKAAGRLHTTRDGQVKGKLAYMPAEQLSGGRVDRQTDVYAAAVVLWEALAGRRLFDGETEAILLMRVLEGKIDPPSTYNPAVDAAADAVVMRGLSRDPAQRYATAREMAVALEQTIGLASPSAVGEWVEQACGDELARRAARIAEVESASLSGASGDVGITGTPAEPPHSQVSSISVARSAATAPVSPRSSAAKAALGALGMLAAAGVAAGLYVASPSGTRPAIAENTVVRAAHPLALASPPSAATKASDAATASGTPHAPAARAPVKPPVPRPSPAAGPPPGTQPSAACDPPYTIDPANGRRKYKMECLGK